VSQKSKQIYFIYLFFSPGSFNTIGSLVTVFSIGFFREKFGEKKTLMLLVFPNLTSWILIFFSTHVYHLYLARFIAGLTSGGLLRIIPIFTGKIAENHVRGEKI
jgi:MFS family permease